MTARQEQEEEKPLFGATFSSLRDVRVGDLAIRFVFGAAVSTVAGLVSLLIGVRAGGLLLGFPAILPATLTLIEKDESRRKAKDDDVGAILGAVALIAFAAVVWQLIPSTGAPGALATAVLAWLGLAVGLYVALRAVVVSRNR